MSEQYAYLGSTEIQRLARDAVKLAAAVKLYAPAYKRDIHKSADRVIKRLAWKTFRQRRGR